MTVVEAKVPKASNGGIAALRPLKQVPLLLPLLPLLSVRGRNAWGVCKVQMFKDHGVRT